MKEVSSFSNIAGPKLNLSKSEGLLLGPLKNTNVKVLCGVKFSEKPIKYLGIYVGHNKEDCSVLNWDRKIGKMEEIINIWGKRNLTVFGKAMVVNVLVVPKVICNCMLFPVPEPIIAKIEKMVSKFLWHGRDRISRNCIINDIENGGINIVDVKTKINSLKAGWVKRWLNHPPWTVVAQSYIEKLGFNFDLLFSMNVKHISDLPVLKQLPVFYQDVWLAFYSSKFCKTLTKMSDYDFLSSQIWGNDLFKFQNRCIFFKSWVSSNIVYVKDVFDASGKFISEVDLISRIKDTRNWMTEYATVKKVILSKSNIFKTEKSRYINMPSSTKLLFCNGKRLVDLITENNSMFYEILVNKKSTRHYMERVWENKFNKSYSTTQWKSIYNRKIKLVPCVKLKEFNYKLIHNLIYSGYILNKWKPSISRNCSFCNQIETTEHLLLSCSRVQNIWKTIGECINIDIKLHHLVIGLDESYAEITNKTKNLVIMITAYSIFVGWVKCGDTKDRYKYLNLWNNVKIYLNYYEKIFENFLLHVKWFPKYVKVVEYLNSINV